MKKACFLILMLWGSGCVLPNLAAACSCDWKGPFLEVVKEAPLVVRGKILRHHPGPAPTMDVLVLEVLKGAILDSGLVIQMGDGMHCRPDMAGFPPDTEWILALNGPGAKPGAGWAISHCGEFWLRVEGGNVVGSIDGDQNSVRQMPLGQFLNRFLYPRFDLTFTGKIKAGGRFRRAFGGRFEFILEPVGTGWDIVIREVGRDENLARLTPPLHFAPNPREIEGWHLSGSPSECRSRPYEADSGPDNPRRFIFSPEVGKRIDAAHAGRSVTPEDMEEIERFGGGTLTIENFALGPGENGCPTIEWMTFSVNLHGGY